MKIELEAYMFDRREPEKLRTKLFWDLLAVLLAGGFWTFAFWAGTRFWKP